MGQIPDFWGNDYFDDTYFHNGKPKQFSGYCTDVFFREAMSFITTHRERPFFVYITTNAPHGPYRVPEKYSEPYAKSASVDAELAKFYGMITNIDENVGRLRELLDKLELSDNTILIFMTDNGTARGAVFTDPRGNDGKLTSGYNAGMRGRKGSPYEGGHRVPGFIHWPAGKLRGGRGIDQVTAHLDLFPTLVELCGLERPAGVEFDGRSLVPLLKQQTNDWQRTLFVHHQELPFPEQWRFGCVLRQPWRLIVRNVEDSGRRVELYDIVRDPGQQNNVADQHSEVVDQLRAAYESWWSDISRRFHEDARIVIGSKQANPSQLTCFEWHGSRRWWQEAILSGFMDNSSWPVEVDRPGSYSITLRRWPEEADQPITAPVDGGKKIRAVKARLSIGGTDVSKALEENAKAVEFNVDLTATKTRLQTWFVDEAGDSRGAYYVTVRFVSSER